MPFSYTDGSSIKNSEVELQSWFIENPISKDLVKSLTIRLAANAEKEFIIVLKAPNNRIKYNLASHLIIRSANNLRRMHSSNTSYEVEKRLSKQGTDISDISIEEHKSEITK